MAKTAVNIVLKALDKASGPIRAVTAAMDKLTLSTEKSANASSDRHQKAANAKLKQLQTSFAVTGAAMTAAITAPMIAAGVSWVKSAADFELGLANLQGKIQATDAETAKLGETARKLGIDTGFGFRGAIEGMTELGKAGLDTQGILNSTKTAMMFGKAEDIGVSQAANFLTDTANSFKVSLTASTNGISASENLLHIANTLSKASGVSSINITDLQNSMKYAAPMAQKLNVPLEDLAASIATLGQLNIKGETGGTALRSFMTTLTGDAKDIAKLQSFGITGDMLFNDHDTNKMKPLNEVFKALKPVLDDNIKATSVWGKEFGSVIQLLAGNIGKLEENMAAVRDSEGFIEGQANRKINTFWGQVDRLKAAFDDIGASLQKDGTLDLLKDSVKIMTDLLISFNKASPGIKIFLGSLAAAAILAGPLLFTIGSMGLAFGGLVTAAGFFEVTVGVLVATFGLWGVAIASIGALIFVVATHLDGVKKIVTDVWYAFKQLFDFTDMGWDGMAKKMNTILNIASFGLKPALENTFKYFGWMDSDQVKENRAQKQKIGYGAEGGLIGPGRNAADYMAQKNAESRFILDINGAPAGSKLEDKSPPGAKRSNLEVGLNGNTNTLKKRVSAGGSK